MMSLLYSKPSDGFPSHFIGFTGPAPSAGPLLLSDTGLPETPVTGCAQSCLRDPALAFPAARFTPSKFIEGFLTLSLGSDNNS